jgi:hypothetical protein
MGPDGRLKRNAPTGVYVIATNESINRFTPT